MGFDQLQNARGYRFDVVVKGDATRQVVITVDLTLFRAHRISIQEGPSLCAQKLSSDLERSPAGTHELITDDLRAYADARDAAEARKLESRSGSRRPRLSGTNWKSRWESPRR